MRKKNGNTDGSRAQAFARWLADTGCDGEPFARIDEAAATDVLEGWVHKLITDSKFVAAAVFRDSAAG
jgi:hypothetical protein